MQKSFINPNAKPGKSFRNISLVLLFLLAIAAYKLYSDVFSSNVGLKYSQGKTYIFVHSNKDMNRFYNELEKGYYLNNFESFSRLANILNLDEKIKPGRYLLKVGMSNYDLIKMLINGRQETINLTFKYAERLENIAGFLGRNFELDSAQWLYFLKDTSIFNKWGFDSLNTVGMFIPNTYNVYWNTNPLAFLDRMHKEYNSFWTAERIKLALDCGLNQNQVSTLASIVQKESNKIDEMPVIAGVYINRLRMGMALQADPTVIYAWNDKSIKRVTGIHTALNSPYNTYLNAGLPPGPICSPSIQAIDAVLNFTQHKYIYFCAREDFSGYHSFAASFAQHQENATRYQRQLNKLQIR
ncbi:MAG: endolytic transglycosylase MltG [Bacteroidia bacterium]|nr:endolytic transglycosylase MltG [Bacteroidia bacterium]MCF8425294.1 endolytic transglycosylase MltG [Bacteroidia bacterium]MCF8446600.1 endolytic transglycosylase MltG [Bacteroidia bacterium]